jgi:oligopeptide/dipeptide ABC transporter ATP-binding protein
MSSAAAAQDKEPLVRVDDLRIQFDGDAGPVRAVDGVSFDIREGETVALVGESGCGKSVTAAALARLVPEPPGRYVGGRVQLAGQSVLDLSTAELRSLRGSTISYIFQDPSVSLNPVFRVGYQIGEALRLHDGATDVEAETVKLLRMVGIADPERRARAYPHEMSGGMQQRVMIAMALACRPRLLVADEPTTALDVTIQAQILELLTQLQGELGMAILLITHNLGLVAGMAHRTHVMYAGQIVESGETETVLRAPRHPYTRGLLRAVPRLEAVSGRLQGIEGTVPNPARMPAGCRFHPRCPMAQPACSASEPAYVDTGVGHMSRCPYWQEMDAE